MGWTALFLILAIFFEVAGTTSMKLSNGFTELTPSALIFIFYFFSFIFLTFSLKKLELGLAYAIWSGLGTLLIAFIGVYYFHEPMNVVKVISLFLIIFGIVGLKSGERI